MHTLIVKFTGLCCFVKHETEDRMKVLLVEGRNVKKGHFSPVIFFNRQDLAAESPRRPDLVRHKKTAKAKDSLCFLDREDLTIRLTDGEIKSPNFKTQGPNVDPTKDPADPTQCGSWSYMPDMNTVYSGKKIDPMCFDPAKPSPHVVARLEMDRGKFFCDELIRPLGSSEIESNLQYIKFGANTWVTAAVAGCRLEIPDNKQVVVASRRWTKDAALNPLVFKGQKSDFEIDIWNVPFYDLMDAWKARKDPNDPKDPSWPAQDGYKFGNSFAHHALLLKGNVPGVQARRDDGHFSRDKFDVRNENKEASCMPTTGPTTTYPKIVIPYP